VLAIAPRCGPLTQQWAYCFLVEAPMRCSTCVLALAAAGVSTECTNQVTDTRAVVDEHPRLALEPDETGTPGNRDVGILRRSIVDGANGRGAVSSAERSQSAREPDVDGKIVGVHEDRVCGLAFSADETRLFASDIEGHVRIWSARGGDSGTTPTPIRERWLVHDEVCALARSPDGRMIAAGSWDKSVYLLDSATLETKRTLHGEERGVSAVTFSPDGTAVAAAGLGKVIRVWDSHAGRLVHSLTGHTGVVQSLAYTPDGRFLVSAGNDGTARLWDATSGALTTTIADPGTEIMRLAITADGEHLLLGEMGDARPELSRVAIWNLATHELEHVLLHDAAVYAVDLGPSGRWAASAPLREGIAVWDTATGLVYRELRGHTDAVHVLTFSPSGARLASGSGRGKRLGYPGEDNTVRVWDLSRLAERAGRGIGHGWSRLPGRSIPEVGSGR